MKTLKAIAARYNDTSLILRIVIGLAVGWHWRCPVRAGWKSSAACSWVP